MSVDMATEHDTSQRQTYYCDTIGLTSSNPAGFTAITCLAEIHVSASIISTEKRRLVSEVDI